MVKKWLFRVLFKNEFKTFSEHFRKLENLIEIVRIRNDAGMVDDESAVELIRALQKQQEQYQIAG